MICEVREFSDILEMSTGDTTRVDTEHDTDTPSPGNGLIYSSVSDWQDITSWKMKGVLT